MNKRLFVAVIGLLISLAFAGACAAFPGPSVELTSSPSPRATPSPAPPTHQVTPAPTVTAAPTPTEPAPTATDGDPPGDGPAPPAALTDGDGDNVVGQLGSWCYGRSCSDTPPYPINRLPKIEVKQAGEQIVIVLPEGGHFKYWRAAYTESIIDDSYGITLGEGGDAEASASDLETASFAGPPAGSWGLMVTLLFTQPDGDAFYSWHAVVGG